MTKSGCICGSGLPYEEIYDGNGIYVTKVCAKCRKERLSKFRPEIMRRPYLQRDVDESIEPEDVYMGF